MGEWNFSSAHDVSHTALETQSPLFYWVLDRWKVSLVDAGCADHLLTVGDPELQQKATDIIVLLLAEG